MTSETINSIIGIKESFELPEKLMNILLSDDEKTKVFDSFIKQSEDLAHDWFTEYFEEQHANKSKMAQDFTPKEVAQLVAQIIGKAGRIADVCAGTGGLTIAAWSVNRNAEFVCYELSKRAVPLLLFNLAIRNISAYVIRIDILTNEKFECFRVIQGERYGRIEQSDGEPCKVDAVISNPPYSLKYKMKNDTRFKQFKDMLPSNYADYVFMAFALSIVKLNGKLVFILPHGVLFRGNKEREFRKYLIENRMVRTIIGLPDKLFINTDIPTMIFEIDTAGKGDGTFFIDAKEAYTKNKAKNIIDEDSYNRILTTYRERRDAERFASFATYQQIAQNDYNMNIPRYVDTYVPEEIPDLGETMLELAALEKENFDACVNLIQMSSKLIGTTEEEDKAYKKALKAYKNALSENREKYVQEILKLW